MKKITFIVFTLFLIFPAYGSTRFQIDDIQVNGLSRISAETVFSYLPVGVGDTFDEKKGQKILNDLFATGFFRDISIQQESGVLVINVLEQPTINNIRVLGNKNLDDEVMDRMLREAGLTEGKLFKQHSLNSVIEETKEFYASKGRYNSDITTAVTPQKNNLVSVDIEIQEGPVARVRDIRFIGNTAFKDRFLQSQSLFEGNFISNLFLGKNKYSKEKFESDLENLRNVYQDRGFFEFSIRSKTIEMSEDKKDVVLTITVFEGDRYRFGDVVTESLEALPEAEMRALITVIEGDLFSRYLIIESKLAIEEALANAGFAFAVVNPVPDVDNEKRTISFAFIVDLGSKTYVRRINITGNNATQDIVIRREMRQMEGAVYSRKKIRRSQERIQRLGFFEDVSVEVEPVSSSIDEVDLNFDLVERKTGNLSFGIGYSEDERGFVQAEISRKNLFGSGRQLEVSLDRSQVKQVYGIEYVNPYYTDAGISRGIFARQKTLDASAGVSGGYIENSTGIGLRYGIPTSEYNAINISGEYEDIELLSVQHTPSEYMSFIDSHAHNQGVVFKASLSRDTRDRVLFPERGQLTSVSSEIAVPGSDVEYYKLTINTQWQARLSKSLVIGLNGGFGVGGGYGETISLPFYRNFYAGGASSVRGYKTRSLGPRTKTHSLGDPLGGSRRLLGNANLYFPVPGLKNGDSTRLSVFVDSGQIYGHGEPLSVSDLRISAGLAFNWFTAIGPLALSYGVPLNAKPDDKTRQFQISFGTLFR